MKDDEMLTTAQVAERLGVSRMRVWQYIRTGKLPAKRLGRDWLIRALDVDNFVRQPTGYPKGRPRSEGGETGK